MTLEATSAFFTDFAVTATVDGVSVLGIFDAPNRDAFGIVADTAPALTLATADAAGAAVNESVVVNGTTYTIARIEPDGTGMTRLVMKT